MNASRTTDRLGNGRGANLNEGVLSVRLEQAILQLRDVERQLQRSISEVLSLQHAVALMEIESATHRHGRRRDANGVRS
jgi:hypothetical protein